MNLLSRFQAARVSRVLMGGAAALLVGGLAALAPSAALAQGKSNVSGCTSFSSFSYDVSSNTLNIVNCSTTIVQPTSGTFSWAQSTYGVRTDTTGPLVVRVNRNGVNGSNAGYYVVDYTVTPSSGLTNWWFNGTQSGGVIPFADGAAYVDLGFWPGSAGGSLTVTLTGVSIGTGMTASSTMTISVTTPGGGGGTIVPGCSTSANQMAEFVRASEKVTLALKPGETGAIGFTPTTTSTYPITLQSSESVNTPSDADHEITVSTCPGDFNVNYPCRFQANYVGNSMTVSASAAPYQCAVTPGTRYYMNVRQIKLRNSQSDPVINSCVPPYGGQSCEIRLQNFGL